MKLRDTVSTAMTGLKAHKGRSALTILGIVIGITAIILMMSIGQGAENLILNEISSLGAETIVLRPGKEPTGPSDVGNSLFADSIKNKDIKALQRKENVPYLVDINPLLIVPGSVSYQGETYSPSVFGASAKFFADAFNVYPDKGALFTEEDIRSNASVAVIGSKVTKELFGKSDAVGENITIKGHKFRVVGVFPSKGQVSFINFDETIIIPHTTAQTYLLGIDYFHEVIIKAQSSEVVDRTVQDIKLTMRESHGITNPDDNDFFVATQQGLVDQVQTIIGALTIFLSSVVAIALVVGGIGVMNIMLVSVTERTKEIGLRKALGATKKDILLQFLFEAVTLTIIGGIIGILLGALLGFVAFLILNVVLPTGWSFSFPVLAAVLGLGMATIVGLIFGIYPARQASKKSPIEALRYE